jgi:hypothetical protein
MIIALLALYPRSWLDWVVLTRLCFGAITYMAAAVAPSKSLVERIQIFQGEWITSSVRLLAVAVFVYFCISRRWGFSEDEKSAATSPSMLQPQN